VIVGILQVELALDDARNLKDKRRVVHSLKDRLHSRFQVSVAEVGAQNNPRVGRLGVAAAASDAAQCQRTLDQVLRAVTTTRGCVLNDHQTEILSGVERD
jgi:uncharacterized protein YlxP (DUF503 family)